MGFCLFWVFFSNFIWFIPGEKNDHINLPKKNQNKANAEVCYAGTNVNKIRLKLQQKSVL